MTSYKGRKLTRKTEDYLEAILIVSLEKGYAKTKDVATLIGVTPSSTVEMFIKLEQMGLVEYRKYEGVLLKPEGEKIAKIIKFRHDTLFNFLCLIDIPADTANRDACKMEHELTPGTILRIDSFVRFLGEKKNEKVLSDFKKYGDEDDSCFEGKQDC